MIREFARCDSRARDSMIDDSLELFFLVPLHTHVFLPLSTDGGWREGCGALMIGLLNNEEVFDAEKNDQCCQYGQDEVLPHDEGE